MCRQRDIDSNIIFAYGHGHPFFIAERLFKKNPSTYSIINHGIGGDRSIDMLIRMGQKSIDVKKVEPDVVSILIGINDVWRKYDSPKDAICIEDYEKNFRKILEQIRSDAPNAKIIINEPFVLRASATTNNWDGFLADTKAFACVAKKLSEDFNVYFLPLQGVLDEAAEKYGARYVLSDGVHPDVLGASIIA
ncbi:MAG: hypothetical protein IJW96_00390, partial [Clostridia bacterium]|nr:hypothetical protein [Clostridia bacterium]